MNPDTGQTYAMQNPERAYMGNSPSLSMVNETFGRGTAEQWLIGQLGNLSEFCGCKDKLTCGQISFLARSIAGFYKSLTMSELLLFFGYCKMGAYGHFYGAVDPMVITEALKTFVKNREGELERIRAEKQKKENAWWEIPVEQRGIAAYKIYLASKNGKTNTQKV